MTYLTCDHCIRGDWPVADILISQLHNTRERACQNCAEAAQRAGHLVLWDDPWDDPNHDANQAGTYAGQLARENPDTMTVRPDHAAFSTVTSHQARKPWVRRIARIFPIYIEHHLTDGSTVYERIRRHPAIHTTGLPR